MRLSTLIKQTAGMLVGVSFALTVSGSVALAAGGDGAYNMKNPNVDLSDRSSVLRGAKLFAENCMGCHSMSMMRYNRIAQDYDLNPDFLHEYGIIKDPDTKIGDQMVSAMPPADAEAWLGKAPPDLTLITRAKSPEYVYNFLRAFYIESDEDNGFRVNNGVLANTSMPNVLSKFQTTALPVYDDNHVVTGVEMVNPESLTDDQFDELSDHYDQVTRDITNFMVYASEPSQTKRKNLGFWVILYLIILSAVLYQLKKSYWKHIH